MVEPLNIMATEKPLPDTDPVLGRADFSAAFQFPRLLLAGTSTRVATMNTTIVREPNPTWLTGIGLVGLVFYGRRRKTGPAE